MAATAPSARLPAIDSCSLDLLLNEYHGYMLASHDESPAGRSDMFLKLERTGFDIGRRLVERMTREKERMLEITDVIKWICRDFWSAVFRKYVDKLQTNNRGTWVLKDFEFRWARYISGAAGEDNRALNMKYTVLPCGIVRGALAAFDFDCEVNVDVSSLPQVIFNIKLK